MNSQKPILGNLTTQEQSMLLAAVLFSHRSLSALFNKLPSNYREKLFPEAQALLALPREQRLTKAIVQLRRLFKKPLFRAETIHSSWITAGLQKEPAYLSNHLKTSFLSSSKNGDGNGLIPPKAISPMSLFFSQFGSMDIEHVACPALHRLLMKGKLAILIDFIERGGNDLLRYYMNSFSSNRFLNILIRRGYSFKSFNAEFHLINLNSSSSALEQNKILFIRLALLPLRQMQFLEESCGLFLLALFYCGCPVILRKQLAQRLPKRMGVVFLLYCANLSQTPLDFEPIFEALKKVID